MTPNLVQFQDAFFDENFEALDVMEAVLLRLDIGRPDPDLINTLFRVAHSIKGGSGVFGFSEVTSLTHSVETLLERLRDGRMAVTPPLLELLSRSVDTLRGMLRAIRDKQPIDAQRVADVLFDIEVRVINGDRTGAESGSIPRPTATARPTHASSTASNAPPAGIGDLRSVRVNVEKLDELSHAVRELVITQAMLRGIAHRLEGPESELLHSGLARLERQIRELGESVSRVRRLPIGFLFNRFPHMVRELSQRLGKKIELRITGDHTELDKTVLEKIGDPLIHLVRNCIDHGIERPEVRAAVGKPEVGTLYLDAHQRDGSIAIEVGDDGAGLDKERILAEARRRRLIGPHDTLTDKQIHDLIFAPGFTTVRQPTDLSGRGVGMDVVRRNVKALGGSIEVHSETGRGARFVITLPPVESTVAPPDAQAQVA